MIDTLVTDLIRTSAENIRRAAPASIDAVRRAPALIGFGAPILAESRELKRFLHANLYRHPRVLRTSAKAGRIVSDLFGAFLADPQLLPPDFQARSREDTPRAIADYIAGMTDRYAIREHQRLFASEESKGPLIPGSEVLL
jgi:dGTPase